MPESKSELTLLLQEWSQGDRNALDRLMPLVADEVRDLARRCFRGESPAHTLQPTALVSEVYLKLTDRRSVQWKNREQFFGFLADLMRRILVDHARKHLTAKRGSGAEKVSFNEAGKAHDVRPADLVALEDALRALAEIDPRKCRIVELQFFVGLRQNEIAEILGISLNTVQREWQRARLWLRRELSRDEACV